ncbi:MAG: hypothetical protein JXR25_06765 [Pontiellaceae bacterium]|nr:hypothetical protein [Pontiellaceae bacterium]MBN2784512.1 hypothetical protein [Pontiellaceae bacterium]
MLNTIRITVLILLVGAVRVGATLLAGWDVAGVDLDDGVGIVSGDPPYALLNTTTDVQHVVGSLSLGPGINPTTTSGQYGFKISSSDETNSLVGAISLGHYIEIMLAVDAGYFLNLDSIELFGEGSANACSNIAILCSVDGFLPDHVIASAYPANMTGGFDTDASGFGGAIDLSDERFQGLSGNHAFRLYGWNSSSGNSPSYIRDLKGLDLKVLGTIATASGGGGRLSLIRTNMTARLEFEFGSDEGRTYLLQSTTNLFGSNVWKDVSGGISSNAGWSLEFTNSSRFYRIIPE